MQQGTRLLYCQLNLDEASRETDTRIVEQLKVLSEDFTHVALVTLSWQERPDAIYNPLVRAAASGLKARGIKLVWGRWLWVAWPGNVQETSHWPSAYNHLERSFYVQAAKVMRKEAMSLEADGTLIDVECYGNSWQKRCFRDPVTKQYIDLTAGERNAILSNIELAAFDYICPTSSNEPGHYAWAFRNLGKCRLENKTYYTKTHSSALPPITPPPDVEHDIDLWGSNVGLGRPEDVEGGSTKLTVTQAKAIDWRVLRERFPNCCGTWVYTDHKIMADVLEAWNRDR